MAIDDRTTSRNYPKPNAANLLSEDVARLRDALDAVDTDVAARAPLVSPTFTGTPAAPTAAADTNTTQLATTGFVAGQAGSSAPLVNGTATVGTSLRFSRQDHVHPTDTTRAPLASPAFTGTPTAPTQAVDNNTTRLATTAYVVGQGYLKSATASSTYAPLASPTFTGTVALPALSYSGAVTTTSTGLWALPSGTTAQRPGSPAVGLRFNSTLGQFEGWNGSDWGSVGGGATGGGADQAFILNDSVVNNSYSLPSGKNAVSAGPITISSGAVVTVPTGSTWVIV